MMEPAGLSEFDFEPVPGLPGRLPPSEVLLWQGAPDWWSVGRRVFHVPLIAGYLGVFVAWKIVALAYDGVPPIEAAQSVALMVLLSAACCGILAALGYAIARTTVYSVTSERVVMRIGIALPMALNIPFARIDAAAVKALEGGRGDIRLTLMKGEKIAYLMLWPHARPWRFIHPEPTLRGLPDVADLAAILGQALAAAASRPATRIAGAEAPAPAFAPPPVQVPRPVSEKPREMPEHQPIARLA